jgi:hypothetical protein
MRSSGLHTIRQYLTGAWAAFGHSFGHNRLCGAAIEEMAICLNLFVAQWDGVGCGGWI